MEKRLDGMKVALACPTYGPTDQHCQRDLRIGIMTAGNEGVYWLGDASTDRMGWSAGRNVIAQSVWEAGPEQASGIMWIDSDMRMKPSDMANILWSAKKYKKDFVSGVYHQREPIHTPVFYHFNPEKQKFQPFEEYPDGVFLPAGGCGFGFVWTSWKAIDTVAQSKLFNREDGWFADKRDSGGFGEDLHFSYLALKAGIELYVHTGVQLGHSGDAKVVYKEDFLREQAKYKTILAEQSPEKVFKVMQKRKWGVLNEIR